MPLYSVFGTKNRQKTVVSVEVSGATEEPNRTLLSGVRTKSPTSYTDPPSTVLGAGEVIQTCVPEVS